MAFILLNLRWQRRENISTEKAKRSVSTYDGFTWVYCKWTYTGRYQLWLFVPGMDVCGPVNTQGIYYYI